MFQQSADRIENPLLLQTIWSLFFWQRISSPRFAFQIFGTDSLKIAPSFV